MTSAAIRPAGPADAEAVLGLFDEAVAWMNAQGNTEQWGTVPWSELPKRRETVEGWCASPGAWIAETPAGRAGGFLAVGAPPAYAPPPPQPGPELYVGALVGSRAADARGYGRALLRHADALAVAAGIRELRVDCFAGRDGSLVRFYESAGYDRDATFHVGDWPGQVLTRTLGRPAQG